MQNRGRFNIAAKSFHYDNSMISNDKIEEKHLNTDQVLTEDLFNIGDRIKVLRKNQKRTLQQIADNSELSKSMISKIENNKTVPSVAALVKIAKSLGTNISNLLEHDGWAKAIF